VVAHEFNTNAASNNSENLVDKAALMRFILRVEMNAMFAKQIKMHLPVSGCLTRWQQKSRLFGVVGTKS